MKKLLLLSLCSYFLLSSKISNATHAAGADLTYEWLGGNDYRITCTFYRDCMGIAAPSFMPVDISSQSCGYNNTYDLDLVYDGNGLSILDYCAGSQSDCDGGSLVGYEMYIYSTVVTLPFNCSDWIFGTFESARNEAITNLDVPGSWNLYVEASLDNLNTPFNNSPVFANKPLLVTYLNQDITMNNGAFDVDGDSLVITSVNPLHNNTTPVTYVFGYSPSNPLSSSTGFNLDPVTGDISFNPDIIQVPVITLKVDEYRNGLHVGSTMRDIQVLVVTGSDELPTLSGINSSSDFVASTCPGDTLTFTINSSDPDAGQLLTVTWDTTIANADFSVDAVAFPTATFTWVPGILDVSPLPHIFTVTVKDDACPYNGFQTYSYKVFVNQCSTDSVWPGDANADYNCDLYDVLPIGLAYGTSGPTRATISTAWAANAGTDWPQLLQSGINYKHADCNGDGLVDAVDLDAITLNYGLSHLKPAPGEPTNTRNVPELYFNPQSTNVMPGEYVFIPIELSAGEIPVNNLYGITFSVNFDPGNIWSGTMGLDFSNSIMAANGQVLTFIKDFQSAGAMDAAVVGINQPGTSQFGLIATLGMIISETATVGETFTFSFANVRLIDNTGAEILTNQTPVTFTIVDATGIQNSASNELNYFVFPNPASDHATVSWFTEQDESMNIKVTDISGKVVSEIQIGSQPGLNDAAITVADLSPGVYTINFISESWSGVKKLLVVH